MTEPLKLILLEGTFTVHRLAPTATPPELVFNAPFFALTRSAEELSIVAPAEVEIHSELAEPGWVCLRVAGTLDFGLVGILAGIATVLAEAGISIFAVSTFDTDYVLLKSEKLPAARGALTAAGYIIQ